jgi:hypothetical protein
VARRREMTEEWRINRLGYATLYETHIFIEDAHGSPICGVWCPPGNEEQETNALLLAAAPKMAKALKMLYERDFCEDCDGVDNEGQPCVDCHEAQMEAQAALLAAGVEI